MSPSQSRDLEAAADRLLASPKAKQARYRIERQEFTEEAGRAMFRNVAGASGPRSTDVSGLPVLRPGTELSADQAMSWILWGGRQTERSRQTRFWCACWVLGFMSSEDAARNAKCTPQALRKLRGNLTAR